MLCLASDSNYIPEYDTIYDPNDEQSVSDFYECPDPNGDQSHTSCCMKKTYARDQKENRNPYGVFKGATKHKCCLPPTSEDSVLKVGQLKLYISLQMPYNPTSLNNVILSVLNLFILGGHSNCHTRFAASHSNMFGCRFGYRLPRSSSLSLLHTKLSDARHVQ